MNLIELMSEMSEVSYVFTGTDGNVYSIEEATKKGIEGRITTADKSADIKQLVFGKSRVGVADMEALAKITGKDSKLYKTVFASLSYLTQKKIK